MSTLLGRIIHHEEQGQRRRERGGKLGCTVQRSWNHIVSHHWAYKHICICVYCSKDKRTEENRIKSKVGFRFINTRSFLPSQADVFPILWSICSSPSPHAQKKRTKKNKMYKGIKKENIPITPSPQTHAHQHSCSQFQLPEREPAPSPFFSLVPLP